MMQAGETTQTMSAMLTAIGSATQRSGAEIGRALRTVTLRLQQVRQAYEGIDFDVDGEIVNAREMSNAAQALSRLGFEIVRIGEDGQEQFASVSETVTFLTEALNDGRISASQLRQVLDALAGQRQSESLLALINNFSEYQQALETYAHGAGSALMEAERAAASWEGQLNRLRNSFTLVIAGFTDVGGIARTVTGALSTFFETLGSITNFLPSGITNFALLTTGLIALKGVLQTIAATGLWKNITGNFLGLGIIRMLPHVSSGRISVCREICVYPVTFNIRGRRNWLVA